MMTDDEDGMYRELNYFLAFLLIMVCVLFLLVAFPVNSEYLLVEGLKPLPSRTDKIMIISGGQEACSIPGGSFRIEAQKDFVVRKCSLIGLCYCERYETPVTGDVEE